MSNSLRSSELERLQEATLSLVDDPRVADVLGDRQPQLRETVASYELATISGNCLITDPNSSGITTLPVRTGDPNSLWWRPREAYSDAARTTFGNNSSVAMSNYQVKFDDLHTGKIMGRAEQAYNGYLRPGQQPQFLASRPLLLFRPGFWKADSLVVADTVLHETDHALRGADEFGQDPDDPEGTLYGLATDRQKATRRYTTYLERHAYAQSSDILNAMGISPAQSAAAQQARIRGLNPTEAGALLRRIAAQPSNLLRAMATLSISAGVLSGQFNPEGRKTPTRDEIAAYVAAGIVK